MNAEAAEVRTRYVGPKTLNDNFLENAFNYFD
jgi:hypothetical protein